MSLALEIEQQYQNERFQKMVNWFVFFMVFPCINILDNSITFYFFLYFVVQLGIYWRNNFFLKGTFFALIGVFVLAALFAPYSEMTRYRGFTHTFQLTIQYIYWALTSCFFIIYKNNINWKELSKWVFYGLIFFTIGFYFVDLSFSFGVGTFGTKASRNAFVFNMLCSVPLAFTYIKHRFGMKWVPYFLFGFIVILMFTNGRSGGIIILVETFIISAILYPQWLKALKILILPLFILFFVMQTDTVQRAMLRVGVALESVNPRLAGMFLGEGAEGNLKTDKSWLERKLQVEKGFEIIHDHPLLGVGPGNYSSYDARLSNFISYERLNSATRDYYNTRSAHNSYIMMMGEFGLLGIGIFVFLQLVGLTNLFFRIFKGQINETHLPLVSLLGLSMHFYAIVAITGSITWFTLGTALAVSTFALRK